MSTIIIIHRPPAQQGEPLPPEVTETFGPKLEDLIAGRELLDQIIENES
jgi:hypothetical protein